MSEKNKAHRPTQHRGKPAYFTPPAHDQKSSKTKKQLKTPTTMKPSETLTSVDDLRSFGHAPTTFSQGLSTDTDFEKISYDAASLLQDLQSTFHCDATLKEVTASVFNLSPRNCLLISYIVQQDYLFNLPEISTLNEDKKGLSLKMFAATNRKISGLFTRL